MKGTTVELVASSWIEVLGALSWKYMRSTPPLFCARAWGATETADSTAAPSVTAKRNCRMSFPRFFPPRR